MTPFFSTRAGALSRRQWLEYSTATILGCSMSGWLGRLAADTAADPQRKRACILLWMAGGPTQMDTFDLKPGHANGGPYKEIDTNVAGIKISEHLPKLSRHMDRMVLVRSMSTKEADHTRATYYLRTGYQPLGMVQYPPLGALVAHELGDETAALPNFVSIGPARFFNPAAYTAGFLGPQYTPLIVGNLNFRFVQPGQIINDEDLKVQDLSPAAGVTGAQADARIELLQGLERDFVPTHGGPAVSHESAYERAVRLMRSAAAKAFELKDESEKLRDAYGRNQFGQGCLLARRLVEAGVPFVEVTLDGWDTHNQNFDAVKRLSGALDPAFATLLEDLKARGLIDTTLVAWMGEFGRTPKINGQQGRDHFPRAWSTVLAGGGLKGGQVVGKTSADGTTVEEREVPVPDFLATVCHALGIDPMKQNKSNIDRPIRIVDKVAKPIMEVIA
jgi:uncharacterized protein (DUF1501 family)